jgi:hypothetical protein
MRGEEIVFSIATGLRTIEGIEEDDRRLGKGASSVGRLPSILDIASIGGTS